jgi:membrane AbrB-like protein
MSALPALGLGVLGGMAFFRLGMPLPWMLGPMLATTLAALAGLPVRVPPRLRSVMLAVLGIMLGSAFTPALVPRLAGWSLTLAGLVPYVAVVTAAGFLMLRRWGRLDPVTAYFTATPGGLNEMTMVGSALGGDERTIALSHALRIMLVVLVVPLSFRWWAGYRPAGRLSAFFELGGLGLADALILASCALALPVARRLRLPAAALLGPMAMSAGLHLGGVTAGQLPPLVVAAAQVVAGSALGCRFAGARLVQLRHSALMAVALTAMMLVLGVGGALLLERWTGTPASLLILAFAPGGLAEMSLIALALDLDVAFVSTHHIVRVLMIVIAAPLVFSLGRRWLWRGAKPEYLP